AARFRKPCATAEPLNVPVCLPRSKLPRIDNLIPLGPKEKRGESVISGCLGGISKQRAAVLVRRKAHWTDLRLVESAAQDAHRVNLEALEHARLIADQSLHVGAERMRQRLGERREQDATLGHRASQMNGAVERDDGLAGTS